MASMHVSLSEDMRNWVEGQVADGRYHNVSEYVRDLIRRDQDRNERVRAVRRHVEIGAADIKAGRFTTMPGKRDVEAAMARVKGRGRGK